MTCRACGLQVHRLYDPGICMYCVQRMEQAIERWREGVERDLHVMVEFDAYCALRQTAGQLRTVGD